MQQLTLAVKTLCEAVDGLPETDAACMIASGIERSKYEATLPIRRNLQKAVSFVRVFTNEAAATAFQEMPQSISDAILQDLRNLSQIAKELPTRCQRQTTSMVPPTFNGQEPAVTQRVEQIYSRLYSNLLHFRPLAVKVQQNADHEGSDASFGTPVLKDTDAKCVIKGADESMRVVDWQFGEGIHFPPGGYVNPLFILVKREASPNGNFQVTLTFEKRTTY